MTDSSKIPDALRAAIAARVEAEACAARVEIGLDREQSISLPLATRLMAWAKEFAGAVALPGEGVRIYDNGERSRTWFTVLPDGCIKLGFSYSPYGGGSRVAADAIGLVEDHAARKELPEILRRIDSGSIWGDIEQGLGR
jgi:hypothetical protein